MELITSHVGLQGSKSEWTDDTVSLLNGPQLCSYLLSLLPLSLNVRGQVISNL